MLVKNNPLVISEWHKMEYTFVLTTLVLMCYVCFSTGTGKSFVPNKCIMKCNVEIISKCFILEEPIGAEFCPFETFRAQCSDNEIIMITHARYGRMRMGKCINKEGNICCLEKIVPFKFSLM